MASDMDFGDAPSDKLTISERIRAEAECASHIEQQRRLSDIADDLDMWVEKMYKVLQR